MIDNKNEPVFKIYYQANILAWFFRKINVFYDKGWVRSNVTWENLLMNENKLNLYWPRTEISFFCTILLIDKNEKKLGNIILVYGTNDAWESAV